MTRHDPFTNRFPVGLLPAPWPSILAAVAVAYTGYLLYATHHPKPELLVGKNLPHDKTLHFFAYGVLGSLVSIAAAARGAWNIRRARFVFIALALFAAVDEVTQPMFGRAAELLDWVYDGIGLAAGLAVASAGVAACLALCRTSARDVRHEASSAMSEVMNPRSDPPVTHGSLLQAAHESRLQGWGRLETVRASVVRPASPAEAADVVCQSTGSAVTPRGLGRSYGDASYDDRGVVIDSRGLDRYTSFDEETGLLRCEAGVSFADIVRTFVPRGWFLATTPGTQFVTVGGAIAADVHGKNHHRVSSFGSHVEEFTLLLASGEAIRCARDENAELFFATLGGVGLTGFVVDATIRLRRIDTAYVVVDYRRSRCLEDSLEIFEQGDADYEHSVAWVDCLATGAALGRGVVMRANHATRADLPANVASAPLTPAPRRPWSVPCTPPVSPLRPWTIRLFNDAFYATHPDRRAVVDLGRFFYPLDSVRGWNRLYGPRGFIQYQAFFPRATSMQGLRELLSRVSDSGVASFLAVMKSCGPADGGLLSYLEPGHTLALDIPWHGSDIRMRELCAAFDDVLLRHGGRIYLAKDAVTTADTFRRMYPRLADFQQVRRQADPDGRFSSALGRRLGIVDD